MKGLSCSLSSKPTKRRAFTLIEMMIVILVVGILGGAVVLTSGAAADKAEAAKIINDMRSLKSACLMHYSDTGEWPDPASNIDYNKWVEKVEKYLDASFTKRYLPNDAGAEEDNGEGGKVTKAAMRFANGTETNGSGGAKERDKKSLYVGVCTEKLPQNIRNRLEETAVRSNLYGGDTTRLDNEDFYKSTHKYIFMRLR